VINDPTTKPCPCVCHKPEEASGHGFRDEYGVWQVENCHVCHGTGRVPMDTGELLEALFAEGWDVRLHRNIVEGVVVTLNNGGCDLIRNGATLDEALRAATLAVTG